MQRGPSLVCRTKLLDASRMTAALRLPEEHAARSDAQLWMAGMIAAPLETLSPKMRCAEMFEWLMSKPHIPAAAIVDMSGNIVGLINRLRFLAHYAQRYIPELYGARPITSLANSAPMIIDEHLSIAALGERLIEMPDALHECFIITRRGKLSRHRHRRCAGARQGGSADETGRRVARSNGARARSQQDKKQFSCVDEP